jgi:uncharacterized membrane protein
MLKPTDAEVVETLVLGRSAAALQASWFCLSFFGCPAAAQALCCCKFLVLLQAVPNSEKSFWQGCMAGSFPANALQLVLSRALVKAWQSP